MTTADLERVLANEDITNHGPDKKSHTRRKLEWKKQARIRAELAGDEVIYHHPHNRWRKDAAGRWGNVYVLARVGSSWHVWGVAELKGARPSAGDLKAVRFSLERLELGPLKPTEEWVGLFMAGTESSARSYVVPLRLERQDAGEEEPPPAPPPAPPATPPSGLTGRPWSAAVPGPSLVMGPEPDVLRSWSAGRVEAWLDTFVRSSDGHRFDGPHLNLLEQRLHAGVRQLVAGSRWAHVWCSTDAARGGWEDLAGARARAYVREVLELIGDLRHWSIAPSFDIHEDETPEEDLARFVAMVHELEDEMELPRHLAGGRAETRDSAPERPWSAGDYAAVGTHIIEASAAAAEFERVIALAGGRRVGFTDRFRWRPSSPSRPKDKRPEEQAAIIRAAKRRNVLIISGNLEDDDGAGGSLPYPDVALIRRANQLEEAPRPDLEEPRLEDIVVLEPDFPGVLRQYAETTQRRFTLRRLEDGTIDQRWPALDWPDFDVLEDGRHIGESGIVYMSLERGRWVCEDTERLKVPREVDETQWHPGLKLLETPAPGFPVAVFVAGPFRHQANPPPAMRHRTNLEWFDWETLERFEWPDEEEPPPPPPDEDDDDEDTPPPPPPDEDDDEDTPPPPPPPDDEDTGGGTIDEETIMAAIAALAPLISEALAAYTKTLDVQLKRMERELIILEKVTDEALLNKYIDQMLRNDAIDLENKEWWQHRFRALGDVFDGDAWERLRELLGDVGINLPATPPAPPA